MGLVYSDKMIEQALIKAEGMPTVAAKAIGMSRVAFYMRVRNNPKLREIQMAARASAFNDLGSVAMLIAKQGLAPRGLVDPDTGRPTGEVVYVAVDPRVQAETIIKLMTMFKGDEGITEKIDITTKGEVAGLADVKVQGLSDEALKELMKATMSTYDSGTDEEDSDEDDVEDADYIDIDPDL